MKNIFQGEGRGGGGVPNLRPHDKFDRKREIEVRAEGDRSEGRRG